MRWRLAFSSAAVAGTVVLVSAQTWPTIPPIPLQERFDRRSELAVTVMLDASQLAVGEAPGFTLRIRNAGTQAVRVPPSAAVYANVSLRLFDAGGNELRSQFSCINQRVILLGSVRDFLRLSPGQDRSYRLASPCELPALPPGTYAFEATYWNYPDSVNAYDVYEAGAADVWEGRVSSRAALTVVPLDDMTERALIALVDATDSPSVLQDALQRLALGNAVAATPALMRRFDRDPSSRMEVARALARMSHPDAEAALAEAVGRLPDYLRITFRALREHDGLAAPRRPAPPPDSHLFEEELPPDPAAVPDYVDSLLAGNDDWDGRQRALKGLALFGTVDDFVRVKDAFVSRDEAMRGDLADVLVEMAFLSDRDGAASRDPAHWETWWQRQAGMTRGQWAREALTREPLRSKFVPHDVAPSRAAAFLLANQGLSPRLVLELAQHRSWLVRIAAADVVANADQQSGGRLYIRELSNRYLQACVVANQRLERLVRRRYRFECDDPSQREKAIAHWIGVIDGLAPGFLPLTVAMGAP